MYSNEIAQNKILQWSLGALVFVYFLVFSTWISDTSITKGALENLNYICPPYFQSCESFYFLNALPHGYSHNAVYMGFFALFGWCVYLIFKKEWRKTQFFLLPIFLWHSAHIFFATDTRSANFEYYLICFGVILLFLPHKEFFLKTTLVFLYVLSTAAKIHPSWIEGSYFTALRLGIPGFPYWSIPLVTNLVIIVEMIGSWFLLSKNIRVQRIFFWFFVLFHLYSGMLVEYRYPATVLPFLLILFGPLYTYTPVPLDKKSLMGWVFVAILLFLQLSPKLIPGDEKLTMEGNKYGLYMFEANHQCYSEAEIYFSDGRMQERNARSTFAWSRCQPYEYWFSFKKMCERDDSIKRIKWTFNHSINGGPFFKIVNEQNACELIYNPFGHNEWIKTENEAEITGYPVKNIY